MECKQLHHFNRECDEVEVWVVGREAVAANEEIGKDLEHVEVCILVSVDAYPLRIYLHSDHVVK